MQFSETLEFDHEDRKRIYEYVESHGEVDAADARDRLRVDPGGFRHHVAILKRDGYLAERDGKLRAAFDEGAAEEYDTDEVSFVIRPARQEDLSGIVGAIREVAEQGSYIVAESVADEIDHDEALLRHNEIESRMFFVATVGEEVVGWVHLYAPELDKLAHTAELTVGVLEAYRDHGIGSHLLERGLEWAASNGYEKVYQSVPSTNEDAIGFLEDHGWETEAVREDHYKIGGEYVDEVMMAVEL
ncbi:MULTISPECIES: bifunctional helix-turn-helix transcriptional regulator/GNAT family N-acetyltransferase [Halorussus]|uniref:bifunctional helix-turn-helix transcriptional regulator/GNAT family N-acetyltransferase n=1 Tax=Halorussus TaxID=1070314 RepID=UPI000E213EAD|nr:MULTISPECIES: bifunctional helix-turn-helix transcriptional regulator/GNAT family N-acetyltransferase [Halorussus]NHN58426.1 GNAT family N-acetyltransferase [Halorussus sp. JP-T4]